MAAALAGRGESAFTDDQRKGTQKAPGNLRMDMLPVRQLLEIAKFRDCAMGSIVMRETRASSKEKEAMGFDTGQGSIKKERQHFIICCRSLTAGFAISERYIPP